MTIFPTQASTLSATALASYVSETFGLGILTGRLLLRGVSDTYLLTGAENKYILKVYRDSHRSLAEIEAEVEMLNILHEHGISVSWPLVDKTGRQLQPFQAAEGLRYGVLFTYAAGAPAFKPTTVQLTITGREMARLHNVTAEVILKGPRRLYNHETTMRQPLRSLAPAFTEFGLQAEHQQLVDLTEKIIARLDSMDTSSFSTGYCHYDFMPKNFHFDAQDQLTFFDFDFMGRGWLAQDVMSYWVHFALNAYLGRSTREVADQEFATFLEAYRSVRPFSDKEVKVLPLLNAGFWIFYLAFHYEHFDDFASQHWSAGWVRERANLIVKLMELYFPEL